MDVIYRIAAGLLVLLHLVFIVFVVFGGLLAFKWPWLVLVHLPAAGWGAIVEYKGWSCPLTPWENRLRQLAGQEVYAEGFIEHYIMPVVYSGGLTRDIQTILGSAVILVNLLVYGGLLYRLL